MTAARLENQQVSGQKQQRDLPEEKEEQLAVVAPSSQPPWKGVQKLFCSRKEAKAAYWSSLTKVHLN